MSGTEGLFELECKKDLFGVMARYLGLSLCKIVRSSVILLLPLFIETVICILLHFNAFGKIFYEAYLRALSTSPNLFFHVS
jgi:hypothetical protein